MHEPNNQVFRAYLLVNTQVLQSHSPAMHARLSTAVGGNVAAAL